MKEVGIYICNYNKREYVVRCVESLLKQTFESQDIYVVDNASEDDSVEVLEKTFGRQISVIKNSENLGGSGGFNVGLRDALKKNYKYVVLVDNDVWVDSNTIEIMYDYMEKHTDVGILGPKILQMDKPKLVQDLGGSIDAGYRMQGNYYGESDVGLPDELECDYISTCVAIARIDAVKEFGLMPEENFIYWDDVEWSKKCQLKGYRTVALNAARAWHKHSITGQTSCFVKYYLTRNRLYFFSKFLGEGNKESFCKKILEEMHTIVFMYNFKGENALAKTVMHAWEDFLHGIDGKAANGRILHQISLDSVLNKLLLQKKDIFIIVDIEQEEELKILKGLLERVYKLGVEREVFVLTEKGSFKMNADKTHYKVMEKNSSENKRENAIILRICKHVKFQKNKILPEIYVDGYGHCIASETDYHYIQKYPRSYEQFKRKYENMLKDRMGCRR